MHLMQFMLWESFGVLLKLNSHVLMLAGAIYTFITLMSQVLGTNGCLALRMDFIVNDFFYQSKLFVKNDTLQQHNCMLQFWRQSTIHKDDGKWLTPTGPAQQYHLNTKFPHRLRRLSYQHTVPLCYNLQPWSSQVWQQEWYHLSFPQSTIRQETIINDAFFKLREPIVRLTSKFGVGETSLKMEAEHSSAIPLHTWWQSLYPEINDGGGKDKKNFLILQTVLCEP